MEKRKAYENHKRMSKDSVLLEPMKEKRDESRDKDGVRSKGRLTKSSRKKKATENDTDSFAEHEHAGVREKRKRDKGASPLNLGTKVKRNEDLEVFPERKQKDTSAKKLSDRKPSSKKETESGTPEKVKVGIEKLDATKKFKVLRKDNSTLPKEGNETTIQKRLANSSSTNIKDDVVYKDKTSTRRSKTEKHVKDSGKKNDERAHTSITKTSCAAREKQKEDAKNKETVRRKSKQNKKRLGKPTSTKEMIKNLESDSDFEEPADDTSTDSELSSENAGLERFPTHTKLKSGPKEARPPSKSKGRDTKQRNSKTSSSVRRKNAEYNRERKTSKLRAPIKPDSSLILKNTKRKDKQVEKSRKRVHNFRDIGDQSGRKELGRGHVGKETSKTEKEQKQLKENRVEMKTKHELKRNHAKKTKMNHTELKENKDEMAKKREPSLKKRETTQRKPDEAKKNEKSSERKKKRKTQSQTRVDTDEDEESEDKSCSISEKRERKASKVRKKGSSKDQKERNSRKSKHVKRKALSLSSSDESISSDDVTSSTDDEIQMKQKHQKRSGFKMHIKGSSKEKKERNSRKSKHVKRKALSLSSSDESISSDDDRGSVTSSTDDKIQMRQKRHERSELKVHKHPRRQKQSKENRKKMAVKFLEKKEEDLKDSEEEDSIDFEEENDDNDESDDDAEEEESEEEEENDDEDEDDDEEAEEDVDDEDSADKEEEESLSSDSEDGATIKRKREKSHREERAFSHSKDKIGPKGKRKEQLEEKKTTSSESAVHHKKKIKKRQREESVSPKRVTENKKEVKRKYVKEKGDVTEPAEKAVKNKYHKKHSIPTEEDKIAEKAVKNKYHKKHSIPTEEDKIAEKAVKNKYHKKHSIPTEEDKIAEKAVKNKYHKKHSIPTEEDRFAEKAVKNKYHKKHSIPTEEDRFAEKPERVKRKRKETMYRERDNDAKDSKKNKHHIGKLVASESEFDYTAERAIKQNYEFKDGVHCDRGTIVKKETKEKSCGEEDFSPESDVDKKKHRKKKPFVKQRGDSENDKVKKKAKKMKCQTEEKLPPDEESDVPSQNDTAEPNVEKREQHTDTQSLSAFIESEIAARKKKKREEEKRRKVRRVSFHNDTETSAYSSQGTDEGNDEDDDEDYETLAHTTFADSLQFHYPPPSDYANETVQLPRLEVDEKIDNQPVAHMRPDMLLLRNQGVADKQYFLYQESRDALAITPLRSSYQGPPVLFL